MKTRLSTALPALDPLPLPAEIDRVVIYDNGYLTHWPGEALPLEPLPYDVDRTLRVASLPPGGGCLDYRFQELAWVPGSAAGCAPASVQAP